MGKARGKNGPRGILLLLHLRAEEGLGDLVRINGQLLQQGALQLTRALGLAAV